MKTAKRIRPDMKRIEIFVLVQSRLIEVTRVIWSTLDHGHRRFYYAEIGTKRDGFCMDTNGEVTIFWNFPKIGAKDSCIFWHFDAFSADYSGRARKMQKNGEIRAEIGVDTADSLMFWVEKLIFIILWYFDTLALCKIKVKVQKFRLENLQPGPLTGAGG